MQQTPITRHALTALLASTAIVALATLSTPAHADKDITAKWKTFKSDEYGFQMKIPKSTKLVGASLPADSKWAGLYARHLNIHLWGVTHKNVEHTPAEIAAFGIKLSKIPAKHWVQVAKGKDTQGFKWYRIAVAQNKKHAVAAIYGVGPQGSYLLFLAMPKWVYKHNAKAVEAWAKSITVF